MEPRGIHLNVAAEEADDQDKVRCAGGVFSTKESDGLSAPRGVIFPTRLKSRERRREGEATGVSPD